MRVHVLPEVGSPEWAG